MEFRGRARWRIDFPMQRWTDNCTQKLHFIVIRCALLLLLLFSFFLALRVRNHDDFSQNFVELVSACLLIPSPFHDIIQTEWLDYSSGREIVRLTK
jgi:hypothetical protein